VCTTLLRGADPFVGLKKKIAVFSRLTNPLD